MARLSGRSGSDGAVGLLLGMQMIRAGEVPNVTLLLILLNCAIYYEFISSPMLSSRNSCIGLYQIFYNKDYKRIVLSSFVHLDEWHLYYNMVSLLWKGRRLEKRFGSVHYAVLMSTFTVLVGVVHLVVNKIAADMIDHSYITQCAAGFSGILFAMKVLTAFEAPDESQLALGVISVPGRYISWLELLLIQVITPNASFNGHLSGIIVGMLYVYGPLRWILNTTLGFITGVRKFSTVMLSRSASSQLGHRLGSHPSSSSSSTLLGTRKKRNAKMKRTQSKTLLLRTTDDEDDFLSTEADIVASTGSVNNNNRAEQAMSDDEIAEIRRRRLQRFQI